MSRGATLAACCLHEPQSISNQLVGLGVHTLRGGIDPGDLRFRPRVAGVADMLKDFQSGDETLPPRVWWDLDVVP